MHNELKPNVGGPSDINSEGFLFESDILIEHEFWLACRSKQPRQPELNLMAAVLDDAIACFFKNLGCRTRPQQKIFKETLEWFLSDEEDRLFSFRSVCSHLAIDADYVKRGLALDTPAHQAGTKRNITGHSKKRLAA